jgi:hypothetical protein
MALTITEKERVRYHLGFASVAAAQVLSVGGVMASYPLSWQLEANLNKVAIESEPRVRDLLTKLDQTEEKMFCAQDELAATQVGNISVNIRQREDLARAYRYWQGALASILMVVPNPADQRFNGMGAGAGNLPVG